ncbi:hypothetical protein [Amycolatopsis aidingensis]|uniref:hypothetical protein n=1 Tax=Amycolatopsis aidingensis TaxID=2842453 RepID=UPI001C0D1BD7|nr:hypothetical protein [Amycolatopsis aidingensis]
MSAVTRLVTFVDVDPQGPAGEISASARHEAELADGSRVLLLDDRGWGSTAPWHTASAQDLRETARVVVGPDEPPPGYSHEQMAADHWAELALIAQERGVAVRAAELRALPHEVVLSSRVRARIGGATDPDGHPADG